MKDIWFSADLHFWHKNIIKYSLRPWLDDVGKEILLRLNQGDPDADEQWQKHRVPTENVEAMNEALMVNWNALVDVDDDVYYLGDFAFANIEQMREIIGCLNGNIHFIKGGHDKKIEQVRDCFVWIRDYYELNIKDDDANRGSQLIVMCHCAFRVWNKSHYGSWSCAAHSHNSCLAIRADETSGGLCLDVGVDSAAYYFGGNEPEDIHYRPFNYENIKSIMAWKKNIIAAKNININQDHHQPK